MKIFLENVERIFFSRWIVQPRPGPDSIDLGKPVGTRDFRTIGP